MSSKQDVYTNIQSTTHHASSTIYDDEYHHHHHSDASEYSTHEPNSDNTNHHHSDAAEYSTHEPNSGNMNDAEVLHAPHTQHTQHTQVDRHGKLHQFGDKGGAVYATYDFEANDYDKHFLWNSHELKATLVSWDDDGNRIEHHQHSFDLYDEHPDLYVLICALPTLPTTSLVDAVSVGNRQTLWAFESDESHPIYGVWSHHQFVVYFEWDGNLKKASRLHMKNEENNSPLAGSFDLAHNCCDAYTLLCAYEYIKEHMGIQNYTLLPVDRNDQLWKFETADSSVCYGRWNPTQHHFDSFIELTPQVFQASSFGNAPAILKVSGQKIVQQNPLEPTDFYEMAKSKHWKTFEVGFNGNDILERKHTVMDLKTFHVISMEKNLRDKLLKTHKMVIFGHTPEDADSQELLVAVSSVLDRNVLWCEQNSSDISSNMTVNVATAEQAHQRDHKNHYAHHHSVALPKMISTDADDQNEAWKDIQKVFGKLKLSDNQALVKDLVFRLQAESEYQRKRAKTLETSKLRFEQGCSDFAAPSDAFRLEPGLAWKLQNFGSDIFFVGGQLELSDATDSWDASIGSAIMVHDFKSHLLQLLCELSGGKEVDKKIRKKLSESQEITEEELEAALMQLDKAKTIALPGTMKKHLAEGLTYGFPTIDEIAHSYGTSETLGVVDPIRLFDVLDFPTKNLRKAQDSGGNHFFEVGGDWHHHETFDFIRKYNAIGVLSRKAYDDLFELYFNTIPEDSSIPSSKRKALRRHFDHLMSGRYNLTHFNRLYEHTSDAADWIIVTLERK